MATELLDVNTETTEMTTAESTETTAEKWYGEDYATIVESKKWTGVDDVLKGYSELEKFKGVASGDHIVLPKSVDDAEGWSKVFNAIGRPETADGYAFDNQSGIELSDELMSGFKAFAHNAGYSQKQLEGAIQFQLEAIKAGDDFYATQQETRKNENVELQKQKWQDDYEPTVTKIDAMAEKLGVKEYFEKLGIDKEPEVVNMLLTIANSDTEDTLETNDDTKPAETTLQGKLKEIMESPEFKERFNPGHKAKMQEFMDMNMAIANAGQGRAPQ